MIDYKKLASKRLQIIKEKERRAHYVKETIEAELKVGILKGLHAKCLVSISDERVVNAVEEIAEAVAKKVASMF